MNNRVSRIVLCLVAFTTTSCATARYADEAKITLKDAIVDASRALTEAEREIRAGNLKTYGLRPSEATVTFDLAATHGDQNTAQLSIAPPAIPASGIFGWTATRSIQRGNHIEIKFVPRE